MLVLPMMEGPQNEQWNAPKQGKVSEVQDLVEDAGMVFPEIKEEKKGHRQSNEDHEADDLQWWEPLHDNALLQMLCTGQW